MITKGIVEEVVDKYYARVRLPVYNGVSISANPTPNADLNIATLCMLPNTHPNLQVGDIVFVGFEDNDMGKPVILGCLYCETLSDSYASMTLNSLEVNVNTHLSAETEIGNTTAFDIKNLAGTEGNLQAQINLLNNSVPTATSDIINDSGFITINDVPKEIFWCTYGTTEYAEVTQALTDGKLPVARDGTNIYIFSGTWSQFYTFARLYNINYTNAYSLYLNSTNNSWSRSGGVGLQRTDNLITTLSSSSTNTQYPSAKCVYDNLVNKTNSYIETAAQSTNGILNVPIDITKYRILQMTLANLDLNSGIIGVVDFYVYGTDTFLYKYGSAGSVTNLSAASSPADTCNINLGSTGIWSNNSNMSVMILYSPIV